METAKALQPYQQRVVDEKTELDSKLDKLNSFFDGNIFSTLTTAEQSRLRSQAIAMAAYSTILRERIRAF